MWYTGRMYGVQACMWQAVPKMGVVRVKWPIYHSTLCLCTVFAHCLCMCQTNEAKIIVLVSVWVRHPRVRHLQGSPSPGSATPRVPILLGLRSSFGGVSTNSTIPAPTARHVTILGRSTRWHSCEDCKVIEPTQYALKRVRFFLFPGSA